MKALKTFERKVNLTNKKEMIDFLKNHFRYDTMNSWNKARSYANKVKIWDVIPGKLRDRAFEILEQGDCFENINDLIRDFDVSHEHRYQAGFNGRSGGYVVLYQGGKKPSGYKSYCQDCGQRNCKTIEETGDKVCGRCGKKSRVNFTTTHMETFSYPGRGMDMEDDFESWEIEDLRARVILVTEFDKLCDNIVKEFIYFCENYKVEEETISVPKKIKILKEV